MSAKNRVWGVISPVYSQSSASLCSRLRTSDMICSRDAFISPGSSRLLSRIKGSRHDDVSLAGGVREEGPAVDGREPHGHLAAQPELNGPADGVEPIGHEGAG